MIFGSLGLDHQLICILIKGIAHKGKSKEKFGLWVVNKIVLRWLVARNMASQGEAQAAKVPFSCLELDHLPLIINDDLSLFLSCFSFLKDVSTPITNRSSHFYNLQLMDL